MIEVTRAVLAEAARHGAKKMTLGTITVRGIRSAIVWNDKAKSYLLLDDRLREMFDAAYDRIHGA